MSTFENSIVVCLVVSAVSLAFIAKVLISIRGAIVECANQMIEGLRSIDEKLGSGQDEPKRD
jgi:hypothetical protein